jgi:hypothetical protein
MPICTAYEHLWRSYSFVLTENFSEFFCILPEFWADAISRVEFEVTLRLAVSQSVSQSSCRITFDAHAQIFLSGWQLLFCHVEHPLWGEGGIMVAVDLVVALIPYRSPCYSRWPSVPAQCLTLSKPHSSRPHTQTDVGSLLLGRNTTT